MFYYYFATDSKANARLMVKGLLDVTLKYSSIYYLDDKLYLVFSSKTTLNSELIKFLGLNSCNVANSPRNAFELLLNWAIFELNYPLSFINYEDMASCDETKCTLEFMEHKIIRSYENLTDMMLIVNVTPDSFSDKDTNSVETQLIQIEEALLSGVSIIDIGAESTRPGAAQVTVEEEIARINTVLFDIVKLKNKYKFKISLDSYKAEVIEKFIDYVDIINDVSGNLPQHILELIVSKNKQYIVMHSLTIPADPNIVLERGINPNVTLLNWANNKIDYLVSLGMGIEQIIIDLGLGFGKSRAQSWHILRNIKDFTSLPCEVLIGHSRKSFLTQVTTSAASSRDLPSNIVSSYLGLCDVDYIRIHSLANYFTINSTLHQLKK